LLAPVAVKLLAPVLLASMNGNPQAAASAALVWFGVMLCVNMQTSFMHPPFGFALFYLRGVAPKEVKSNDIYWGALPWVVLQLIMVVMVAAFPALVTTLLDKPVAVVQSQDFNFTGGDEAKPDAPPSKTDEDAPVVFQLDKSIK
jgi:TRAP-type C4-dicarboxylate transport system permease large subunit